VVPANVTWSAARGTIDDTGVYRAPATAGGDTITATGGAVTGNANVNVFAGGTVSGRTFHDINASGGYDSGDLLLGGVRVYLDANYNGSLDPGELSTTSGAAGDYAFYGVPVGGYFVREVAPVDFVLATAPGINIGNGTVAVFDLANARIVYTGTDAADRYLVRLGAGGKYEVLVNGGLAYSVFAAAPSLTFNLLGGDDTVEVLETAPGGRIEIVPSAGNDTLNVNPDDAGAATVRIGVLGAHFAGVNIGAGGRLELAPGAGATSGGALEVQNLTMNPAGLLDLADNSLRVATTDANSAQVLALLNQRVGSARNGVATPWSGPGITSSTARDDPTGLSGVAVAAAGGNEVLVRYALAADANLDGKVTFEDLVVLAQNYSATGRVFSQGDFNFDTNVDFEDLVLLAQRYDTALPQPQAAASVAFELKSSQSLFSTAAAIERLPAKPKPAPRAKRQGIGRPDFSTRGGRGFV
jgi:hypothetical protein